MTAPDVEAFRKALEQAAWPQWKGYTSLAVTLYEQHSKELREQVARLYEQHTQELREELTAAKAAHNSTDHALAAGYMQVGLRKRAEAERDAAIKRAEEAEARERETQGRVDAALGVIEAQLVLADRLAEAARELLASAVDSYYPSDYANALTAYEQGKPGEK